MSEPVKDWATRADQLAGEALRRDDPTGWFDRLYAEGRTGQVGMPWDRTDVMPLLGAWLDGRPPPPAGTSAVVVGSGLGADAAALARLGYDTLGFDVAPSAVAEASIRHTGPDLRFQVADLFALPATWAFDLVVEIYTVQALPRSLRERATAAVRRLVAPGGTLVVVAAALPDGADPDEGPPWALTEAEADLFVGDGLALAERRLVTSERRAWVLELRRDGCVGGR